MTGTATVNVYLNSGRIETYRIESALDLCTVDGVIQIEDTDELVTAYSLYAVEKVTVKADSEDA